MNILAALRALVVRRSSLVILFLLAFFLTFSIFTASPAGETFQFSISTVSANHGPSRPSPCPPLGDGDRDGDVDEHDLDFIADPANNIFGQNTPLAKALADVNGDDVVTTGDIQIIERYIDGEIDRFEACADVCDQNYIDNLHEPGAPPAPCTCQLTKEGPLTNNYVTDEFGEPPLPELKFTLNRTGPPASTVTFSGSFTYSVDFSKLQALFGATNSDYLEGKYQDGIHRQAELLADIYRNHRINFFGPGQKAAPKVMTDQLKVAYVKYIYNKPGLDEASNKYTDINGNGPQKTIYEMTVLDGFGLPDTDPATSAPTPPGLGGDSNIWQASGWASYWPKIPTAYSEFYDGFLSFHVATGEDHMEKIREGSSCPEKLPRDIKFIVPEFFRTAAVSGQLNQVIVPKAAQSTASNNLIIASENNQDSLLAKLVDTCLKFATQNPISKALRKVVQISLEMLTPVKTAYAQTGDPSCVKVLLTSKFGKDPYCALPADQLESGESCTNANDEFRLDLENENVVCTFNISFTQTLRFCDPDPESTGPSDPCAGIVGNFDDCSGTSSSISCSVTIRIYPNFRIPWTTEIWNNTLYADENEQFGGGSSQVQGVNTNLTTGRPGVYTFFTPKNLFDDELTAEIKELLKNCDPNTDPNSQACQELLDFIGQIDQARFPEFFNCTVNVGGGGQFGIIATDEQFLICAHNLVRNLLGIPGQSVQTTTSDLKERFVGGVDCSKYYVKRNALYPLAAQRQYGDNNSCAIFAASDLIQPEPPGGTTPGDTTLPNPNDCDGKYSTAQMSNPLGNFGDPNCNFSRNDLFRLLNQLDPANASFWFFTIVPCEAPGYNPLAYNAASTAGQAFGLFQMGHDAYPQLGLDMQIADINLGPPFYDRGDVDWRQQTSNAINYNNQRIGGSFAYWACA